MYSLLSYSSSSSSPSSSVVGPVFRSSSNVEHNATHQRPRLKQSSCSPSPYNRFVLKASATVSLSNANANAACITTTKATAKRVASEQESQNAIPFPSAPILIDFPSTSAEPRHPRPIPRRRRSNTPSLPSIHPQSQSQYQSHSRTSSLPSSDIPRSRKHTYSSPPQSSSSPSPRPKRARKNRRVLADLHFFAIIHRSIVYGMRARAQITSMDVDVDGNGNAILLEQDELLAKRLWTNLMEHGCEPVLFSDRALLLPLSPPTPSLLLPSSCLEPEPMEIDVITEVFAFPERIPSNLLSPSLSAPPPSPAEPTLTMPQLVASLIMRHRSRSRSRTRASSPPLSSCGSLRTGYVFPTSRPEGEKHLEARRPGTSCGSSTGRGRGGSPLSGVVSSVYGSRDE